jgi:DNA-binding NarL/FixJ family response regulator
MVDSTTSQLGISLIGGWEKKFKMQVIGRTQSPDPSIEARIEQPAMIRLLVADAHELVREGLRATFEDTEVKVVCEATTGEEAIWQALNHDVDVVLLDIKMPPDDGLDVLRRIKSEKCQLPVLIYSLYARQDYLQRAHELGASGYLSKRARKRELLESIRRVNQGDTLWRDADDHGDRLNRTR